MNEIATEKAPARTAVIADAAMRVLAEGGARGLSHLAVDRRAGLPKGSTSNYFNSRDLLLTAAFDRMLELDTPPRMITRDADAPISGEQARKLLLAAIDRRLDPDRRHILLARYELFLESTRRPEFRERLLEGQRHFLRLTAGLLSASGCATPEAHGAELLATIDGVLLTQVTFNDSGLDQSQIEETLERMLAKC